MLKIKNIKINLFFMAQPRISAAQNGAIKKSAPKQR
jgi:hypothetical protein